MRLVKMLFSISLFGLVVVLNGCGYTKCSEVPADKCSQYTLEGTTCIVSGGKCASNPTPTTKTCQAVAANPPCDGTAQDACGTQGNVNLCFWQTDKCVVKDNACGTKTEAQCVPGSGCTWK